mgnify:CR=1
MGSRLEEGGHEPRIERVLVAVDASQAGLAALRGAVRFASAFDAELVVLYVEDEDLLNLPHFSFLKELDPLSGELRSLNRAELERRVRMEAARIRRDLERAVLETSLRWSFRVSRGRVVREVMKAAETADAVSLGARRHSLGRGPGSTARAVLDRSGRPVVMLWTRARPGDRICVVYDGSPGARAGLATAARLSQGPGAEIAVLLRGVEEEPELGEEAISFLRSRGVDEGTIATVPPVDGSNLARTLRGLRCDLLVLPRNTMERSPAVREGIRRGIDCPLLVMS